jgi:hypothetical protein
MRYTLKHIVARLYAHLRVMLSLKNTQWDPLKCTVRGEALAWRVLVHVLAVPVNCKRRAVSKP